VDVQQALADLTEISSQIEAAVLFGADGAVAGSTLADEGAARGLATAAGKLLAQADGLRGEDAEVTQIEASTGDGCVFVVRDGERRIAATTVPNPTVGLVFYDLKSCLRDAAPTEPEKPKRRRTTTKKADEE
jgi:predicted regulator of Ras-like GTPase activity (Roadblock/LC7/MglB family)